MTEYSKVYDAFFPKIKNFEWIDWTEEEIMEDARQMLEVAIAYFKFPRISLERDEEGFLNDLTSSEIQILAAHMRCEWYERKRVEFQDVAALYDERDFSPSNFMSKLGEAVESERIEVQRLEDIYYRSINGKPYAYRNLAG